MWDHALAVQGFFLTVGIVIASFYNNCVICLYYLSIITYNKKDDYIKRKLEPWFHGVPIVSAIVIGITGVIVKQYNNDGIGGLCYTRSYHPPHCRGVANGIIPEGFTVPCGRGDTESGNLFEQIIYLVPRTITPAIIVGSMMVTMYRTVRKIERKMFNYGVRALRLRASQRHARVMGDSNAAARGRDNQKSPSVFFERLKIKLHVLSICSFVFRHDDALRSNNAKSQKRAIFYMAMNYSLTWALTWIPLYILLFVINNHFTRVINGALNPLQGLYNLIVYMSPKVRNARNKKRAKLPWCQAIIIAWMSRGEKDRTIVGCRDTRTSSLWQRLQSRLSRFIIDKGTKRSPTVTPSSKTTIYGDDAITEPSSTVPPQNKGTNIDRKADNEEHIICEDAHVDVNEIVPRSINQKV